MITLTKRERLNRMNSHAFKYELGSELDKKPGMLKAVYDFSTQGGAIGDISLKDVEGAAAILPSGAIVTKVFIDVVTAVTSDGAATVAVKSEGAGDMLSATAKASFTLAALLAGVQDGAVGNMIRMTADRTIKITVAAADLTAGKLNVFIEYVLR
jgi:hypothetical protein